MKINFLKPLSWIIIPALLLTVACKRDDDDPEDPHDHNEEELITTVELQITDMTNNGVVVATWSDPDGPGGNDATIDSILLDANRTYEVSIEFSDRSGDTPEDITAEIQEEDDEHIICLEPSTDSLSIVRTDSDGQYEVGLKSDWMTKGTATANVTISLKHQPDVKDGTCAPGETDVEVVFPVEIK